LSKCYAVENMFALALLLLRKRKQAAAKRVLVHDILMERHEFEGFKLIRKAASVK